MADKNYSYAKHIKSYKFTHKRKNLRSPLLCWLLVFFYVPVNINILTSTHIHIYTSFVKLWKKNPKTTPHQHFHTFFTNLCGICGIKKRTKINAMNPFISVFCVSNTPSGICCCLFVSHTKMKLTPPLNTCVEIIKNTRELLQSGLVLFCSVLFCSA